MENGAVFTGDIINFTSLNDIDREALIKETTVLIKSWVNNTADAAIFRGDSYQILFENTTTAIIKSIQLICWFKKPFHEKQFNLSTRISIGIGEIAYKGNSVLDSDGEAFHLSGRRFDNLEKSELLSINTHSPDKNKQLKIILMFVNMVVNEWTPSQAEAIYLILENRKLKQETLAKQLKIHQSGIAKRLKLAHWKEIDKTIDYIINDIILYN